MTAGSLKSEDKIVQTRHFLVITDDQCDHGPSIALAIQGPTNWETRKGFDRIIDDKYKKFRKLLDESYPSTYDPDSFPKIHVVLEGRIDSLIILDNGKPGKFGEGFGHLGASMVRLVLKRVICVSKDNERIEQNEAK